MQNKRIFKLRYKVALFIIALLIFFSAMQGIFSYYIYYREFKVKYSLTSLDIAKTIALNLDANLYEQIMANVETTEEMREYRENVNRIFEQIKNITGVKHVYALGIKDSAKYSYFASAFSEIPLGLANEKSFFKGMNTALEKGRYTYTEIYTVSEDENLINLISGFAPIINSDGIIVGVVGVDMDVSTFLDNASHFRQITLIISIATIVFSMFAASFFANKFLRDPIKAITEAAKDIVNGKVDIEKLPVQNDEIGLLSENFKKLHFTIIKLSTDLRNVTKNLIEGNLDIRIDISDYSGEWNHLMNEFNIFFDKIVAPINESKDVLEKIEEGDFDARVEGDYKGSFAIIKDAVNSTAEGLNLYLNDKLQAERDAYEARLEKERADAVFSSIDYASKIQKSILPSKKLFEQIFSDYSILWNPRDIVGGDIYWLKRFEEGAVLCVCDCTGHGIPGAFITMLVASAIETSVSESSYKDPARIIYSIDSKLANILNVKNTENRKENEMFSKLNDGCDIAVLFIDNNGTVSISSVNIRVFVCDGESVNFIKGQKLNVGDGLISSREDVEVTVIPSNSKNKFYVASDGLYDQIGGEFARPFGYKAFKQIILESHNESQNVIAEKIWGRFEEYRGNHRRRDDVELITFKL